MSRQHKSLIVFGAAWGLGLAALAVFHFAAVAPRGRAVQASRQQTAARIERVGVLTEAKSPQGRQRIKQEQDAIERQYADFVFAGEQFSELDFRLRAVAEKNGLLNFSARHVGTVSKVGDTALKRIAQRDLILSFNGAFADFLRFLNELERHQPLVFVHQFTVRNTLSKDAGGKLACDLDCSVLYQTGK